MCIYDLQHIKGRPGVRIGESGEQYPGIGRQIFQMENKVVIADDDGIIGNTVSDSERTKARYQIGQPTFCRIGLLLILAALYACYLPDSTLTRRPFYPLCLLLCLPALSGRAS